MPIQFTCPHCGTTSDIADEYAGQTGPCIQCGKTITIPPASGPSRYRPPPRQSSKATVLIVLVIVGGVFLVCGGILVALMLPAVQAARDAARRAQCSSNLRQISIALMMYEQENGCYPPAYLADEEGKRMHSWRVLLLPYLEMETMYDQYDFDEPWDSPKNRAVTSSLPTFYHCASAGEGRPETDYVMVVGAGTISDGPTSSSMEDITDGLSQTIIIVEIPNSDIEWAEPRDLDVKQIGSLLTDDYGTPPGGNHPGVVLVLLADGSVRSLNEDMDPETVRAWTTIAGGEDVDPWELDY